MDRGLYICAGVTAAMGAAAYALLPITGMANMPLYSPAPLWIAMTATVLACQVFWTTVRMAASGQDRPLARLWANVDWTQARALGLWTVLLSLNLAFFCMIKPQLGQLVAFSADPLLADVDRYLFGADPWLLLGWFNHPYLSNIYHRGWFLWLAFVLFYLITKPESEGRSRLLVSYVLLWAVGPIVHLTLPAAGPVFYDELGYGDRFVDLYQSARTEAVANYLWNGYAAKIFNPAGGISAMPSLHLATMFWSLIAVRRTKWFLFGLLFTAYIFLGSIVIGWHYAVDGIVGGILAAICYALAGFWLRRTDDRIPRLQPNESGATVSAETQPAP